MIKQVKRYWYCECCGSVVDHFRYKYDFGPSGEDEAVCPECGVDVGFIEVTEQHWKIKKIVREQPGLVYEIKCAYCGHCETALSYPWPSRCYVCDHDMTGRGASV